jgi:hypothetical protein
MTPRARTSIGITVFLAAMILCLLPAQAMAKGHRIPNMGPMIDAAAPVTTSDAPADWQSGCVTVTLSASDDVSGVADTFFRIDGGDWRSGTLLPRFGVRKRIGGSGVHTIDFYSVDNLGHVESAGSDEVKVDNRAPFTRDNAPADAQATDVTVALTATDTQSGVAATFYSIDNGTPVPGTSVLIAAPLDHTNDGSHVVTYFSVDNAGNAEADKTVTVVIDTMTGPQ